MFSIFISGSGVSHTLAWVLIIDWRWFCISSSMYSNVAFLSSSIISGSNSALSSGNAKSSLHKSNISSSKLNKLWFQNDSGSSHVMCVQLWQRYVCRVTLILFNHSMNILGCNNLCQHCRIYLQMNSLPKELKWIFCFRMY